jgi:hypothetical protein
MKTIGAPERQEHTIVRKGLRLIETSHRSSAVSALLPHRMRVMLLGKREYTSITNSPSSGPGDR